MRKGDGAERAVSSSQRRSSPDDVTGDTISATKHIKKKKTQERGRWVRLRRQACGGDWRCSTMTWVFVQIWLSSANVVLRHSRKMYENKQLTKRYSVMMKHVSNHSDVMMKCVIIYHFWLKDSTSAHIARSAVWCWRCSGILRRAFVQRRNGSSIYLLYVFWLTVRCLCGAV